MSNLYSVEKLIEDGKLLIGDGYRAKNIELCNDGFPFLRVSNIKAGQIVFDNTDFFPRNRISDVLNKVSKPGDIVFTSKGTVGRFAYVDDSTPNFVYSPQLCFWRSLDHQLILPQYLYYWMQSEQFIQQVNAVKGQTDMADYVSLKDQRMMKIALPDIEEQKRISDVLSAFDDKIELNRQMNQTLEAMARAIFKSWFVDFDPVRAKAEGRPTGLPAEIDALFPDGFEESELGEIPRGWRVGTIGDIGRNPRKAIQPDEIEPTKPYIGLEHMPRKSIALYQWGEAGEVESNKFSFSYRNILFGKLRPYFHKVGIAPTDGVCSTDILVITPQKNEMYSFLLEHLSSNEFIQYVDAASQGTRMPRTNWETIARYGIVVPDEELLGYFNGISNRFFDRLLNNIHESNTLQQMRDTLLPRLLSGGNLGKTHHIRPS